MDSKEEIIPKEKSFRNILANPIVIGAIIAVIGTIITAIGILVAAILTNRTEVQKILIPIQFTQTAEAIRTQHSITLTSFVTPTSIPTHTIFVSPTNSPQPTKTPTFTLTNTLDPYSTTSSIESLTPSISPTNTATITPSNTATITPSNTATLEPIIDPIAFRGLDRECVDIDYWNVGPDYAGYANPPISNHCWLLDSWNIYPVDGGLRIVVEDDKLHHNDVRGIYIYTPQDAEIHFSIRVISVSSGNEDVDAMILMGFGSRDSFRTSGRYVKISANASENIPYIETGSGITNYYSNTRSRYNLGNTQDFTIFLEGSTIRIFFGSDIVYRFTELESEQHEVFWIGYQVPGAGGDLFADITNFTVIEK